MPQVYMSLVCQNKFIKYISIKQQQQQQVPAKSILFIYFLKIIIHFTIWAVHVITNLMESNGFKNLLDAFFLLLFLNAFWFQFRMGFQ